MAREAPRALQVQRGRRAKKGIPASWVPWDLRAPSDHEENAGYEAKSARVEKPGQWGNRDRPVRWVPRGPWDRRGQAGHGELQGKPGHKARRGIRDLRASRVRQAKRVRAALPAHKAQAGPSERKVPRAPPAS